MMKTYLTSWICNEKLQILGLWPKDLIIGHSYQLYCSRPEMEQLDHLHPDQCGRNQMFSLGADRLRMTAHNQLKEIEKEFFVLFYNI